MHWRAFVPALFFIAFGGFIGLSLVAAQSSPAKNETKCAPKDGAKCAAKDGVKDGAAKDGAKDGKKEEWLDDEAMETLMSDMQENWDVLKARLRAKMGKDAAEAADKIAEMCPKMLKFHKKEVREAKDYKDWTAELEKYSKEFSKHAKKSDWDEATKAKDKMSSACGACHKKYRPEE